MIKCSAESDLICHGPSPVIQNLGIRNTLVREAPASARRSRMAKAVARDCRRAWLIDSNGDNGVLK